MKKLLFIGLVIAQRMDANVGSISFFICNSVLMGKYEYAVCLKDNDRQDNIRKALVYLNMLAIPLQALDTHRTKDSKHYQAVRESLRLQGAEYEAMVKYGNMTPALEAKIVDGNAFNTDHLNHLRPIYWRSLVRATAIQGASIAVLWGAFRAMHSTCQEGAHDCVNSVPGLARKANKEDEPS